MNITQLNNRQSSLADIVTDTNANIDQLNVITENQRLDIDHINNLSEQNCNYFENLELEIERLNTAQISANMRIFGLDVKLGDSENCAKQKVIKHVLNKACPDYDWVAEDIKRVQVISSPDSDKFPLVIVHFRFDDDKFRIYRGREELRKYGLRVGDDLTYRQRQKIKKLKEQGSTGYFYKGKMHIRENNDGELQSGNVDIANRATIQAARKLPGGNVNTRDNAELNMPTGMQTDQLPVNNNVTANNQ